MAQQWEIQGKTFLITGGASGLGAQYAEAYLKEGARKVAILDVAEQVGKATTDRLNSVYPDRVVFIKCDVSNEEDITAGFNKVAKEFGQVDVIINNAGIMVDGDAMWRKANDVNWVPPFFEQTGVRVLTICFGPTKTPLMKGLKDRSIDNKTGLDFDEFDTATGSSHQKVESAVTACLKMFREGGSGSVWVSNADKPAEDVTTVFDKAYKDFEKLIMP